MDKVENRLCSSKAVAEGVKATVAWVFEEEGAKLVDREVASASARKQSKKASPLAQLIRREPLELAEEGDVDPKQQLTVQTVATEADSRNQTLDDDDEDRAANAAGWESGSISDAEGSLPMAPSLIGDDVSALPIPKQTRDSRPARKKVQPRSTPLPSTGRNDPSTSLRATSTGASLGDSDPDGDSYGVVVKSLKRVKQARSAETEMPTARATLTPSKGPITSSTFLPSLSTGYTLGDSDSDPDMDEDPDGTVGKQKAERKNRRGQRARQA